MKIKTKSITLGLLAIALISTLLMSCEQNIIEDLTPTAEEQLHQLEDRLPPLVIGTWWNSYEEETDETKIYRRDDYNFPNSGQPRTGFIFDSNGDFVYYYINDFGQLEDRHGRWRFRNSQNITIRFDSSPGTPVIDILRRIRVISTTDNMLVIHPLVNW